MIYYGDIELFIYTMNWFLPLVQIKIHVIHQTDDAVHENYIKEKALQFTVDSVDLQSASSLFININI